MNIEYTTVELIAPKYMSNELFKRVNDDIENSHSYYETIQARAEELLSCPNTMSELLYADVDEINMPDELERARNTALTSIATNALKAASGDGEVNVVKAICDLQVELAIWKAVAEDEKRRGEWLKN